MSFEVSDLSSVNTSICSSSTKLFSIISSFCKLKPNSSRVGKDIISYDNLEISFLTVSSLNLVSKILLTIAAIVGLVVTIGVGITTIVLIIVTIAGGAVLPASTMAEIEAAIKDAGADISPDALKWIVIGIISFIILMVGLLIFVIELVATLITFKGKKQESKGSQIACIVLGAISGNYITLVGGILGTIAFSVESGNEEPKQVEEKAE